ncbi:MAG: tRNA pseudouridine(55) synthase TruB [Rhodospirillaceae bacterium]|nr:tRNA pseudouridine(55) synthase TruB [Rhodospirillaceae bacterium]
MNGSRPDVVARPTPHGWLVIDKEGGMTSAAVVARVRRLIGVKKVGHGGTLDPMAEGILPIAIGEATKTVSYVMDADKAYRFTVRWGEGRDTDDAEGRVTATSPVRPDRAEIEAALPAFQGEIMQVPPHFSAIKVDGRRAYDLARRDEMPTLSARPIRVERLSLVDSPDPDHGCFEVECGKGTYVRALARDLAVALGTVGHVTALRRLRVGAFDSATALTLNALESRIVEGDLDRSVLSVAAALSRMPAVELDAGQAQRLKNGQMVPLIRRPAGVRDEEPFCTQFAGRPVALARLAGGEIRPIRVFNF